MTGQARQILGNSGMDVMGTANHFLFGFKSHSASWNPHLEQFLCYKSMDRKFIGPRGEPIAIILLNIYNIKLTVNDLLLYP